MSSAALWIAWMGSLGSRGVGVGLINYALLFLVVVNSVIAYGAYYWLISAVSPVVLGTFAYVTPTVAMTIGVLIMGETLSDHQVMGSLMILGSVVMSAFLSRHMNK